MPDQQRKQELLDKHCPHSSVSRGGVHTRFDGYGDRSVVGLDEFQYRFICWDCHDAWGRELSDLMRRETDEAFREAGLCGYTEPYRGRCKNERPCEDHGDRTCFRCDQPATKGCSHAGTLVCGMPECDEHSHH